MTALGYFLGVVGVVVNMFMKSAFSTTRENLRNL
jgi:hypothetical protein